MNKSNEERAVAALEQIAAYLRNIMNDVRGLAIKAGEDKRSEQ